MSCLFTLLTALQDEIAAFAASSSNARKSGATTIEISPASTPSVAEVIVVADKGTLTVEVADAVVDTKLVRLVVMGPIHFEHESAMCIIIEPRATYTCGGGTRTYENSLQSHRRLQATRLQSAFPDRDL